MTSTLASCFPDGRSRLPNSFLFVLIEVLTYRRRRAAATAQALATGPQLLAAQIACIRDCVARGLLTERQGDLEIHYLKFPSNRGRFDDTPTTTASS